MNKQEYIGSVLARRVFDGKCEEIGVRHFTNGWANSYDGWWPLPKSQGEAKGEG